MTKTAIDDTSSRSPQGFDTEQLCAAAIRGLEPMFDNSRNAFCFQLKHSPSGLLREGISLRYTMMTLMGLQRAKEAGFRIPFDTRTILDGLVRAPGLTRNVGDFGLLLWTCALVWPERCAELCSTLMQDGIFGACQAAREGRTMELAWFLSGLAHVLLAKACPNSQDIAGFAHKSFEFLTLNQGRSGFFGHLATRNGFVGRLRGRVGSFADQVYPIYAFSKFSQVCNRSEALPLATKCADAICRVQGELGQWWWHYDSVTGRVIERYPVYAVHQEGMAPMALFALEQAVGLNYAESIERGLAWIFGRNETGCDLRAQSGIVWRCLRYPDRYRRHLDRVRGVLGRNKNGSPGNQLRILYECRPYELGWLLYALAGK